MMRGVLTLVSCPYSRCELTCLLLIAWKSFASFSLSCFFTAADVLAVDYFEIMTYFQKAQKMDIDKFMKRKSISDR